MKCKMLHSRIAMNTDELLKIIPNLENDTPMNQSLERALGIGPGYGKAWYSSQQEHWMVWLKEYTGTGPYHRIARDNVLAETVYNRLMCPPMLFWLVEAAGVDQHLLRSGFDAALAAQSNCATQTAAIRKVIPWGITCRALTAQAASGSNSAATVAEKSAFSNI